MNNMPKAFLVKKEKNTNDVGGGGGGGMADVATAQVAAAAAAAQATQLAMTGGAGKSHLFNFRFNNLDYMLTKIVEFFVPHW